MANSDAGASPQSLVSRAVKPLATAVLGLAAAVLLQRLAGDGGPLWAFGKLFLVLALMVLLLREGVMIGVLLLVGALTLGLAFDFSAARLGHAFSFGIADAEATALHGFGISAVRVGVMVFLLNLLGRLLILSGGIRTLVEALERLFRDIRWVMAAIPAAIGLLPMPGGAMLSAPMVGELGDRLDMSAEQKVLGNYWFRHVWEWWWPIYPAIIIVVEDGYLSLPQVLVYQGPYSLAAIGLGWFFIVRRIRRDGAVQERVRVFSEIGRVLRVLWPVLAVVVIVLAIRAPKPYNDWLLPASLLLATAALVLTVRPSRAEVRKALRLAAEWKMWVLVFGIYVLRCVFTLTGAAAQLLVGLETLRVPAIVACFFVPFVINSLTGYNMAGVSMAFPLLAALFADIGPKGVAVAYAGAFLGILASPVHLCLALTREYFRAEWGRVYAQLAPLLLGILAMAILIGWLG